MPPSTPLVRWLSDLGSDDLAEVGGKNASLGELRSTLAERGIRVPDGFATTAGAYRAFVAANELEPGIRAHLEAFHDGREELAATGRAIRALIYEAELPEDLADAIREAYRELGRRYEAEAVDVAVRSSATAEDLPEASFAGQLDSFLNVSGEDELLRAFQACFRSLFTDRAIAYRENMGFDHLEVALSVGVQKMVRSDTAGAGVLFTLDTDSGFPRVVVIDAAFGLGESVVQGTVDPDHYTVFKPFLEREELQPIIGKIRGSKQKKCVYSRGGDEPTETVETSEEERRSFVLTDAEILRLARWGAAIEEHYGKPMDVEWAKDGQRDELYIVQARPETVHSRKASATLKSYRLKEEREPLVTGLGIGQGVGTGEVCILRDPSESERFPDGGVLVARMTDPDWVPLMERASAIVTDSGGRTSHAAIVSREMGLPAVVGTGKATSVLEEGQEVTVSCAEGDEGHVYEGRLDFEEQEIDLEGLPETRTRILLNVASPAAAMRWWKLPCRGVGLARMEYLINNVIQVHPLALTRFDQLEDRRARDAIEELTRGYPDKEAYFVEHLARGIATIAASRHPDPVIVRMSDFKTNEYADLIGGRQFEPEEQNPMLGWRGASRYYSEAYRDGFALECRAVLRARSEMGFENLLIMIPFCRTPEEADRVLEVMAQNGLRRGVDGLQVYVMAEIPSNILEAEAFAERFDGFSIGSNDLTQLVLGIARDAENLAYLFDESEPSVKQLIATLIEKGHAAGRQVGICGEAPSNDPEFAAFLVRSGIDSISLAPDSVLRVIERVAEVERG